MKKMKLLLAFMIGSVGVFLSGCNSTRVYSDYVQGINFQQFNTYAFLPSKDSSQNSLYENQIVSQNLRNKVNQEMKNRGYAVDVEKPDLLILMHTKFQEKEELVRTPIYSSYSYYYPGFYAGPGYPYYYNYYNTFPGVAGYDIRSVEFTEGTIVVDIIRAETNELIWRGWTRTAITDPNEFRDEVNDVIEDIFDKYPVEEKKK